MIKKFMRKWLGIDDICVRQMEDHAKLLKLQRTFSKLEDAWARATAEVQDIGFKGDKTRIVVASNLGQGFCKWYELDFRSYKELQDFCSMLNDRQVMSKSPIIDAQGSYYPFIDDDRHKRGLNPRVQRPSKNDKGRWI